MARDYSEGRDLPEEDRVPDLPVRPASADMGYGLDADDVTRGYCSAEPEMGDNRAGEIDPPMTSLLPTPKGFLYRGTFPSDR